MRILVLSDSHGGKQRLCQAIESQPCAQHVFFLGDGERDFNEISRFYPDRVFSAVQGNCDFCSLLPTVGLTELAGKRIFYTHGHAYHVKYGAGELLAAARQAHADLCFFGHTHRPVAEYHDGLYLMNPGSIGHAPFSYGIADITPAGIVCQTRSLSLS